MGGVAAGVIRAGTKKQSFSERQREVCVQVRGFGRIGSRDACGSSRASVISVPNTVIFFHERH